MFHHGMESSAVNLAFIRDWGAPRPALGTSSQAGSLGPQKYHPHSTVKNPKSDVVQEQKSV